MKVKLDKWYNKKYNGTYDYSLIVIDCKPFINGHFSASWERPGNGITGLVWQSQSINMKDPILLSYKRIEVRGNSKIKIGLPNEYDEGIIIISKQHIIEYDDKAKKIKVRCANINNSCFYMSDDAFSYILKKLGIDTNQEGK